MRIRKSLTALALTAAIAAPAALATAAPASAIDSYAAIRVQASSTSPGYYDVIVYGYVNNAPPYSYVTMSLKGDDPWSDDDLGVRGYTQSEYGHFSIKVTVPKPTLNEDWEGCDEVYASVSSSTGWKKNTPNHTGCY
ncbi:hypothetical protein [Motilibacter deserti]|uniref:Secreted protein n=1 Tax=Motilibacter deserti TaxID=2714956 RepID=A0ABX0GXW0_9ACTN|nr:hypothetical protein [Motilibacter deserti]NHC15667.1 hypothetical protein [Motilibacter deserti]